MTDTTSADTSGCEHLDEPYRRLLAERDELRAERNSLCTEVGRLRRKLRAELGVRFDD